MTARSKVRLGDLFPELYLSEDYSEHRSLEISGIAPVENAREGDLVFVAQENILKKLSLGKPSAAVVSESCWAAAQAMNLPFALLCSKNAMLAFAKASRHFSHESVFSEGVHPSAVIHSSAKIGAGVSIGPFCVVGQCAELGEGVTLEANVTVGPGAKIGAASRLFSGVVIYAGSELGQRVRVHSNSVIGADGFGYVQERVANGVKHVKIHHLGKVVIGNDVEIGASTTIDRGTVGDTVIGRGAIIDNQVQIGHNCQVGEGVVICGCSALGGSAKVGNFAVIAGAVGVANKIEIGAGAQISGFSSVPSNVPAGVVYGGVPAMPHRQWLKVQVLMQRLPKFFDDQRKKKENV